MRNFPRNEPQLPPSQYVGVVPGPVMAARPAGAGAPDSVSFGHLLQVFRRHIWLVLGVALAGLIAGIYLAYQQPRVYRASALIRLADTRRVLAGTSEDAPTMGKSADRLQSLMQLATSRQVISAVVDSLGMQLQSSTPEFALSYLTDIRVDPRASTDSIVVTFGPTGVVAVTANRRVEAAYNTPVNLGVVRFTPRGHPGVPSAVLRVAPRDIAVDGLIGRIEVVGRGGTDLVDVSSENADPATAQRIVNMTVKVFQSQNIFNAQETSRRRRMILEQQLRETDSLLEIATANLSQFQSLHGVANSSNALQQQQQSLLELAAKIGDLSAQRQMYGGLLNTVRTANGPRGEEALRSLASAPEIATNQVVSSLYGQLNSYRTRLDSLTTGPYRSAESNPDVVQLRKLVDGARENLVGALASQVSTLDARIAALRGLQSAGRSGITRMPEAAGNELQLTRKVETLSRNADNLRTEYQNARMAEAVEAGEVEIVNLADLPYAAFWPGGPQRVMIGLVLGLLLGGGLALFLERANTSIRRPEDLEGILPVPGLAVIPLISNRVGNGRRLGGLLGKGSSRAAATENVVPQPLSVGTEAFRMLRTSLVWSELGDQLRTIVVTSAAPGEGKTLTAANLALIFAHEGRRVLLVDCDVRRPKLHKMLGMPRAPGLADLLRSDEEMAAVAARVAGRGDGRLDNPAPGFIRTTSIRGLHLLPSGSIEPTMADLSSASRIRTLLDEMGTSFDVVILDTPPVLAVADASILGALADGVLLVVRAGRTDRTAVLRAHQHLAQVGAHILGTVFNDPEGEVTGEGGYYYPYDYAVQSEKA
jgi:succinoglycan biosynthesis transport protein ExoP